MKLRAVLATTLLVGAPCVGVLGRPPLVAAQERRKPSLSDQLELGVDLAKAGDLAAAIDQFLAVRDGGDAALHEAATFDWSRALFEKASRRPIPDAPPSDATPSAIADVRTLLASMRGDLDAARRGLLELAAARPDDAELRVALAHVAGRLRDVERRDEEWRALALPSRPAPSNGQEARPSKLTPGPSGKKASAGAKSKRPGQAAESDEGAKPGGNSDAPFATVPSTAETREKILDLLEQVRKERVDLDVWRGDAAHDRAPARRQ
jgi:hypothetical protein